MSNLREITAAKDLLLDRLMLIHPEINGGGVSLPSQLVKTSKKPVPYIKINLEKPLPKHARVPKRFMGFDVKYEVVGWIRAQGTYSYSAGMGPTKEREE